MAGVPKIDEARNLFELRWAYARDGKVAIDADTGLVVDANPAVLKKTSTLLGAREGSGLEIR